MKLVIAIDGPAAAGKGTLARRIATELGLPYLDTGLLYRAVGRRVLDNNDDPADPRAAEDAAASLSPADLERPDLRGPQADAAAASVAVLPGVRAALLAFQRNFAASRGAVLDGRDIGTTIFPEATAKFFVTASIRERAHRRWSEMQEKDMTVDLSAVEADMCRRDAKDAQRSTAPLRQAEDAFRLDTSQMTAEAVFEAAMACLRGKGIP